MDTPEWCAEIINQIFMETIFIQKIIRQNQIDLGEYTEVVEFFNEEARGVYLSS